MHLCRIKQGGGDRTNYDFIHKTTPNPNTHAKTKRLAEEVTKLTTWAVGAELLAEIPEVVQILWHLKRVEAGELISLV